MSFFFYSNIFSIFVYLVYLLCMMTHIVVNYGGEAQLLKKIEQKVKDANDNMEQLSKAISGLDSEDAARLRLVGGDKENQGS